MATNSSIVKILLLAANPKNTSRLRLDEEVREIREGLRLAREREQFQIDSHWAVRTRDFYRQMLDMQPQIVHFSGHGTGKDGIVLEDETGKAELLSTEQLSSLFKLFASSVKCVLLNACYSEEQANAIANHIPYVIGMNQSIGDKAAIIFAVAFYDALGAGKSIDFAFELGVARLRDLKEHENPVLIKKNPNLQAEVLDSLNPTSAPMLNPSQLSDKAHTLIQSNAEQIGMVVQGGTVSFDNLNMN